MCSDVFFFLMRRHTPISKRTNTTFPDTTRVRSQGNFGEMDPDPPAAMRYSEARLARVANALLDDIDKDTVDFQPNDDASESEPQVLPARFPNILVNGAGGIAVGMATNIPPHNLGDVLAACKAYIDRKSTRLNSSP